MKTWTGLSMVEAVRAKRTVHNEGTLSTMQPKVELSVEEQKRNKLCLREHKPACGRFFAAVSAVAWP